MRHVFVIFSNGPGCGGAAIFVLVLAALGGEGKNVILFLTAPFRAMFSVIWRDLLAGVLPAWTFCGLPVIGIVLFGVIGFAVFLDDFLKRN